MGKRVEECNDKMKMEVRAKCFMKNIEQIHQLLQYRVDEARADCCRNERIMYNIKIVNRLIDENDENAIDSYCKILFKNEK